VRLNINGWGQAQLTEQLPGLLPGSNLGGRQACLPCCGWQIICCWQPASWPACLSTLPTALPTPSRPLCLTAAVCLLPTTVQAIIVEECMKTGGIGASLSAVIHESLFNELDHEVCAVVLLWSC